MRGLREDMLREPFFDDTKLVVWIGTMPDSLKTVKRDPTHHADLATLTQPKIFPNRLAATDQVLSLLESEHVPRAAWTYPDTAVHGIALLSPRTKYSALDQLDCMQEVQRAWFSRLAPGVSNVGHLFFFQVLEYLPLDEIKIMPSMHRVNSFFAALPAWLADQALFDIQLRNGAPEWLVETQLVLRIAKPFAAMLDRRAPHRRVGMWHPLSPLQSLAVCDVGPKRGDIQAPSWSIGWETRSLRDAIPVLESLRSKFSGSPFEGPGPGEFAVHKDLGLNALKKVMICSRNIANQAVALCSSVPALDPRITRTMEAMSSLHDIMVCVQAKADEVEGMSGLALRSRVSKHAALQLIHDFFLCQELQNDAKLRVACQWALRLTLPASLADEYVGKLCQTNSEVHLPSASTISRARGRIDASYVLVFRNKVMKELINEGFVAYLTWDASPQGGKELEMFVWNFVKETFLQQLQSDISWLEMRCFGDCSECVK